VGFEEFAGARDRGTVIGATEFLSLLNFAVAIQEIASIALHNAPSLPTVLELLHLRENDTL
jgi:hypothetical protein